MTAGKNQIVWTKIFGAYVMNTRYVPSMRCEESAEQKKREQRLFEDVDDYVEQA